MTILVIDGEVSAPCALSIDQLAAMPESAVDGDAVRLSALLDRVAPTERAAALVLHASKDDYRVEVPLAEVRERGRIVFRRDGQPLGEAMGGPFRFRILDAAACKTATLDQCANVKYVDRIELTTGSESE